MPLNANDWTKDARTVLTAWCASIATALRGQLPTDERYWVEAECVAREAFVTAATANVMPAGPPTLTAPARFADRFAVHVLDTAACGRVGSSVLFVTPDNKADSDGALALAVRAAFFLSAGAAVVLVDALPGPANWATHLQSLVPVYPVTRRPRNGEAPIVVIHSDARDGKEQFQVWHYAVAPGSPLPTVPVPVCGAMHLSLDLEATLLEACRRGRFPE